MNDCRHCVVETKITLFLCILQHSTSEPSPDFGGQAAFRSVPQQSSQPASVSQQSSQPASTPARDASSGNDLRSSGRKELPVVDAYQSTQMLVNLSYGILSKLRFLLQELFTSSYAPFPAAASPLQFHPPHGMGYGMQYNPYPRVKQVVKIF